jgi:colanic acid/amylovoran biosynthesis glycosyltransferase
MPSRHASSDTRLCTLQIFHQYLDPSENWAYRLLSHCTRTRMVIGAETYLYNDLYDPRFTYILSPIHPLGVHPGSPTVQWLNRYITNLRGVTYPWFLEQQARHQGCRLIHSHFANVGWYSLPIAKRLHLPHVVSFYGLDYEWLPFTRPEWRPRYQELIDQADLFICEGEHGVALLRAMGCPEEKATVVHLGVEVETIPWQVRKKQAGELHLLQIARLIEKKGHIDTVRAFLKALQHCPNMTLTIAAPGSEKRRQRLDAVVRRAGAEDAVTFLDWVNFATLHQFMLGYQVFIHPSRHACDRDCEGGAPVVLIDAEATGMPVIATDHCDIPEVVVNGRTGLLTPERDVDQLAASIERFYWMDQDEYRTFCEQARRHVEEEYSAARSAERLEMVYASLIEQ